MVLPHVFVFERNRNRESLEFLNGKVIRIEESTDIDPALFATTTDGKMFNVSAPDLGSEWKFDNLSVAQITKNGKIQGLKTGLTVATVTVGTYSQTISVDVDVKPTAKTDPIDPNDTEQHGEQKENKENEKEIFNNSSGGCNSVLCGLLPLVFVFMKPFRSWRYS